MKDIIKNVLDSLFIRIERSTPNTKKKTQSISIMDIKPIDLLQFMNDNDIPKDADFDGRDNGYDGWNDILLSWKIDVPTTEKDKLQYKKDKFNKSSWTAIYTLLTNNGYKTVSFNSGLLKEFDNTSVYDMYMEKDFDRLEKYYSLRLKKYNDI